MSRKGMGIVLSMLVCGLISVPALGDSHVRIVRLSLTEGGVSVDRGTGQFEKAILNLPITQGMKLRTSDDGRAEVEFEDGSTLRLTPDTSVQFPELSLKDSGTKVSLVQVSKGMAYVEATGNKNDELTIQFGQEKVQLTRGAHARVGVDKGGADLSVFKGDLEVDGPSGEVEVRKNQTAQFDFAKDSYKLAKKIQDAPEDDWDKQQDQYHQQYASKSYSNFSPYDYGTSDLTYYGNFFNAPGYGMLWQPFFVGAGWNPFMDGAWTFYPGFGFGWISAYPWGWVPFHYGSWMFLPSYGWAWQPGGVWTPMYTQMAVLNAPAGFVTPRAPASGTSTVFVGRRAGSVPSGSLNDKVVIRRNSAGLGVPRGEFGKMAKLSNKVEKRGAVTEHISTMPATGFGGMESRAGEGRGNSHNGISRAGQSRISEPRSSEPRGAESRGTPFPSAGTGRAHGSGAPPHR